MRQLKGLPYYGGKSPARSKAGWICSIMGFNKRESYIEPFAGMLGVLLSRPKTNTEIVNDTNGDLVNWWKCVRDHGEELARLVALTPWSREVFSDARSKLKSSDPLIRALAFHVICEQSLAHAPGRCSPGDWGVNLAHTHNILSKWTGEEFRSLALRVARVQIENRCALELLDRTSKIKESLIYCDPPYKFSDMTPYGKFELDRNSLKAILLTQKGRVAISGYGDEWDCLGWTRSELKSFHAPFGGSASAAGAKGSKRVEVLWTNFEPSQGRLFPM